ncbi:MAG: hypothetical protein M3Y41_12210, partial [Pseudomonadota bacterium]|nr:hypothetical protein [Pseudomonadota bacterium]
GIADAGTRADLIALLRLAGPDWPIGAAAAAPEASEPDLKTEPAARQVRAIRFCGDTYRVTTQGGSTRAFWGATCASRPIRARAGRDPAHR